MVFFATMQDRDLKEKLNLDDIWQAGRLFYITTNKIHPDLHEFWIIFKKLQEFLNISLTVLI